MGALFPRDLYKAHSSIYYTIESELEVISISWRLVACRSQRHHWLFNASVVTFIVQVLRLGSLFFFLFLSSSNHHLDHSWTHLSPVCCRQAPHRLRTVMRPPADSPFFGRLCFSLAKQGQPHSLIAAYIGLHPLPLAAGSCLLTSYNHHHHVSHPSIPPRSRLDRWVHVLVCLPWVKGIVWLGLG